MLMKDSKKMAAMIIKGPGHDMEEKMEHDGAEHDNSSALHSAAEEIMHAMHMKDAKSLMTALKSFWEICDSEPHEEGPHIDEETEESPQE